ncbi:leucine-rich repeat domain-containing protein [bacterium]|nr:leucine-rich repeat domain-containing protein [bacterium]
MKISSISFAIFLCISNFVQPLNAGYIHLSIEEFDTYIEKHEYKLFTKKDEAERQFYKFYAPKSKEIQQPQVEPELEFSSHGSYLAIADNEKTQLRIYDTDSGFLTVVHGAAQATGQDDQEYDLCDCPPGARKKTEGIVIKTFEDLLLEAALEKTINFFPAEENIVISVLEGWKQLVNFSRANREFPIMISNIYIGLRLNSNGLEKFTSKIGTTDLLMTRASNFIASLDISNTGISHIPKFVGSLKNLRHLDLSYNDLKTIPEALGDIKTLGTVDLSNNCIHKIPGWIRNWKIQTLDLRGNEIKDPPQWAIDSENILL